MQDLDKEELEYTRNMREINKIISPEEKSADEMFEELGYEKSNYGYKIIYTKTDGDDFFVITIMTEAKLIFAEIDDGCDEIERRTFGIQIQELQAINKKVEELGWIE